MKREPERPSRRAPMRPRGFSAARPAVMTAIALAGLAAGHLPDAVAAPILTVEESVPAPASRPAAPVRLDNEDIRALLGIHRDDDAVQPSAFSGAGDVGVPSGSPGGVPAPAPAAETLRAVLRSLVTVEPAPVAAAGPSASDGPGRHARLSRDDPSRLGIAETILDSETLGRMAAAAVRIDGFDADGPIFSVLGIGNFHVDVGADGTDVDAAPGSDPSSDAADPSGDPESQAAPVAPAQKIDLGLLILGFVSEFLETPLGMITSVAIAVYLVISGLLKFAGFIQWWKMPEATPSRHRPHRHRPGSRAP